MDCLMKQKTVRTARKLLDTFEEKALDGDFVLPEYLPEMAAVLACRLIPTVENRQLGGNRLIVDGTVRVHVLYVDQSRDRLYTYETSQPFTATFTADGLCEPATVYVEPMLSYVNYRAVGPRRLDIRSAWRLYVSVYDAVVCELPDRTEDEGVCLRSCSINEHIPAQNAGKLFTVNEALDVGGRIPEKVVRCSAEATVSECKILPGKAILKGEITLHTLYEIRSHEGENAAVYASCDHTLLYSQMVDCVGLNDTQLVECAVSVLSCDVRADTEEGTGRALLIASVRLSADLQAWESCRLDYVSDAYGIRCPSAVSVKEQAAVCFLGCHSHRFPLREEWELPDEVRNVIDVWCDLLPLGTADGSANYRASVHLLAAGGDGALSCYERAVDFELPLNTSGNTPHHSLRPIECSYHVKDGGVMELNVVTELHIRDMELKTHRAVSGITLDETHPYPVESASVKMIFAESGESVWEIAKSCHADAEKILLENDLTADLLDDRKILLIPLS